jgi:glycosyltransferase involved in cell wall biosynthesis
MYENGVLHGQQVARQCLRLRQNVFMPDIIVAHPGWGESLFVKDIFPRAALLHYCEFYYHGFGTDIGFDPAFPADFDMICRARALNAHLLLGLEACDRGISPTHWQRRQHPMALRDKIDVIFDGVDARQVRPDADAWFTLPNGAVLSREHEVVTYVARSLEPYRGFPSFMRALPRILASRPRARVVVVGDDNVTYGQPPTEGGSWRAQMLNELGDLDAGRVHFLGSIAYEDYLRLLQVSTVHVYLTVPFVLSWSCVEALAAGCVVVGSRTPPVVEVIEHGRSGILVDFFSPDEIADQVVDVLRCPEEFHSLRLGARESVLDRFDLAKCLPEQIKLVRQMVG